MVVDLPVAEIKVGHNETKFAQSSHGYPPLRSGISSSRSSSRRHRIKAGLVDNNNNIIAVGSLWFAVRHVSIARYGAF